MSRIGRMPITVPQGVKVNINGTEITVTGPKGELKRHIHPDMILKVENGILTVNRPSESREHRSLHGLTRTLIANMVEGVTKGFQRDLEIVGVGYRGEKAGDKLVIRVGFSHPVEILPVPGITLGIEGANKMKVSGIDKEIVGEMAARIKALKPHDAYKGKGIRYAGEPVKLKAGKAAKAIGKKG